MLPHGGSVFLPLVLLICLGSIQYSLCQEVSHCRNVQSTKLIIRSTRNYTGHWTSKVTIENADAYGVSTGEGLLGQEHWKVEVDHHTGGCGTKEAFSTIISLPPPQGGPGYELLEGVGYYKFHKNPKIWPEALKVCEQEGAHIAIINSEKEADYLKLLFSRNNQIPGADFDNAVGIGFHDRYIEGDYLTIYDEPLSTTGFVRWSHIGNQPDNWLGSDTNPGEDCGSMARDGGLNDIACDVKIGFICEREL